MDGSGDEEPTGSDWVAVGARLSALATTHWPDRLARLRADPRRGLPFAVATAWPLSVGASLSLLDTCETLRTSPVAPMRTCLSWAFYDDVLINLGSVLVAALLAALVGYTLVGPRVERALDDRLGRLLFAPDRTTLAVLGLLHVAALALGGPLFEGRLVASRRAFYLLAVPAYPLIGGMMISNTTAPLFDIGRTALPGAIVGLVEVPWLLALSVVTVALNAVWVYVLATAGALAVRPVVHASGRARSALQERVADRR